MIDRDTPEARIGVLLDRLRKHEVQRIEIIQIPPNILTRTRVTPELLEQSYNYKLVIRDIRGNFYENSLISALTSTSVHAASEMADVRWGISFFHGDELIERLYFDPSGGRGAVGSIAVSFGGNLFQWLAANFSDAFK
jgi:hypothetical protein